MSRPQHAAASHSKGAGSVQLKTGSLLPNSHAHSQMMQQQSDSEQRARQRHNVHVMFLESPKNDHMLNRVTAALGRMVHKRGFCHVEIAVPDPLSNEYLSSSIYNGETVTLSRSKTFANPGYTIVSFTVNGNELQDMTHQLNESKRVNNGFDAVGMYLAALPFQASLFPPRQKTFCSKHVTTALQAGRIEAVDGINANVITPSKLYRLLNERIRKDRLVMGSVAYKQQALAEKGAVFTIQ